MRVQLTANQKELLELGKERFKLDQSEGLGTKGDFYNKKTLIKILEEGYVDENPRPKYHDIYIDAQDYDPKNRVLTTKDGEKIKLKAKDEIHEFEDRKEIWTPAHTVYTSADLYIYNEDVFKGENPLITTRYVPYKDSIAELIWIWLRGSNDLVEFDELLSLRPNYEDPITHEIGKQVKVNNDLPGCRTWMSDEEVAQYINSHPELTEKDIEKLKIEAKKIHNWWFAWAIRNSDGSLKLNEKGHPTIGTCYGYTNRQYKQIWKLIEEIRKDPFGRRHILNLCQFQDLNDEPGLYPCAYETLWTVRPTDYGTYMLDCSLIQRSSDFVTAGPINQYQYMVLQYIIAAELGFEVGSFKWFNQNIQIYDRHIDQALEQLNREPINCNIETVIHNKNKKFDELLPSDIEVKGYSKKLIDSKNPKQYYQLGI